MATSRAKLRLVQPYEDDGLDDLVYDGTTGDPTVVAYDPGGVTGWAVFSVHPDSLTDPEVLVTLNVNHFACGEFSGAEAEEVDEMVTLAEAWPGAALLLEDFVPQKLEQSRAFLSPVRINAAFKYEMRRHHGRRCWMQMPALAKTTITMDRLRAMETYWKATEGKKDARMAVVHALVFLKRLKADPKLLAEVFPALASEKA